MNEGTNEEIKLGKVATKYAPDFTVFLNQGKLMEYGFEVGFKISRLL